MVVRATPPTLTLCGGRSRTFRPSPSVTWAGSKKYRPAPRGHSCAHWIIFLDIMPYCVPKNAIALTFALALAALFASVLGQPSAATGAAPVAPVYERVVEIWYSSTNCDNATAITIRAQITNCSQWLAMAPSWNWTPPYQFGSCRTTDKPRYGNAGSYYAQCGSSVTADMISTAARAFWPRFIARYAPAVGPGQCQATFYAPLNFSLNSPPPYTGGEVYTCVKNATSTTSIYWSCSTPTNNPTTSNGCTIQWSGDSSADCFQYSRGATHCEGSGYTALNSSGGVSVR